jgi:hypothetical protein
MKEMREKAARFYFKELTGELDDWVEGRDDGPGVDPDVKSLAILLEEVYRSGQRSATPRG